METLLPTIALLFTCIILYLLWRWRHATIDPHQWWLYVEQAAFREKKADMQRRFPVYHVPGATFVFGSGSTYTNIHIKE